MAGRRVLLLLLFSCCQDGGAHRLKRGSESARIPDTLTEHMRKLYEKYTQGHTLKDGNTVRSYRGQRGSVGAEQMHVFNLTSLKRSESVLSATLHFNTGDHAPRRGPAPRTGHAPPQLLVWSYGSGRALGHVRFSLPHVHARRGAWQWRDVTRLVNAAAERDGELLVGVRLRSRDESRDLRPYLLLYANDSAIAEPLSGHAPSSGHVPSSNHTPSVSHAPRQRRSVDLLAPLQNNELPETQYHPQDHRGQQYHPQDHRGQQYRPQDHRGQQYRPQDHRGQYWDEVDTNAPKNSPKDSRRLKKKSRKESKQQGALLRFDERALKKARRKWAEPRGCARRRLKVDFADIGWSDWIISPKAYDAFYCAGSCHFPMSKALKPSNHATIQSIVRAVGVVPGVPEPCCVPEKMSSLSILFFDEQANVVLKVYPNMSVETCACR